MKLSSRYMKAASLAAILAAGVGTSLSANAQDDEKVLRIGMATSDAGRLDPHVSTGTPEKALFGWMFNGLVRIQPGKANPEFIEPDLAESWESSEDGLTWTFNLREGVQCHGEYGEFTAEDAVYSLRRAQDPDLSAFASDLDAFESVEALDDYTLQIDLNEPVPSLLGMLINVHAGNMVCKDAAEEMGEDFALNPIGTGPFMFSDYAEQESVTLVANPDYFRGKPKIDRIDYRFIPETSSRDLAYEAGELDMAYGNSDQKWYNRMNELPETTVVAMEPAELYTIHLNMTEPPLDDPKVRQAVMHAIPRDLMVEFRGEEVVRPGVSPVPQGYLGHINLDDKYSYDPERARELLEEAGHPDGIELTAIQTSLGTMQEAMEIIQGQLAEAGINLELDIVEHATFHSQIRDDRSQVVLYAAARFPIADVYLTQFYHSDSIVGREGAVTNFSHCDVADEQIEQARVETDPDRQIELWQEAQELIADEVCSVPVYEALQMWVINDRVDLGYEDLEGSLSLGPALTENSQVN
ncbi:ABC transporter substrate-binding protein [Fodinicurvata halophila]|uniref:ABC transporter substrate-binding protein n=1 Tax=Fodinicurvata halophila TaxID=1419723 RepID=A0ABV8UJB9_9PROT